MAGHVFVVHGDLTRLRCDAWLMPCDSAQCIEPYWLVDAPEALKERFARLPRTRKFFFMGEPPDGWGRDGVRVQPVGEWNLDDGPCPWLVDLGGGPSRSAEWFIEGARQFFEACRAWLGGWPWGRPRWRHRPLLAVPLVGTGHGGARHNRGGIIRALLELLFAEVGRDDLFDVVLVVWDRRSYDATQAHRRALLGTRGEGWEELDAGTRAHAERLAELARQGRLALFLGAGISQGAGLPGWGQLLRELSAPVALSESERRAFVKLDAYDQARILERRLGGFQALRAAVAARLRQRHHAISHALLVGLDPREMVTTNYDGLMESALAGVGAAPAVLPYEPASRQDRWILKLHGCVNRLEEIVFTREDYMRYADRRAALAGLVQGLLITRHMLFVGFSLVDDNFHRIADDVRKALGRAAESSEEDDPNIVQASPQVMLGHEPFGTALLLERNPLMADLWRQDLDLVAMSDATPDEDAFWAAARRLEVFLDHLGFLASNNTSWILDPTYTGLLSPPELELRRRLQDLQADLHALRQAHPRQDLPTLDVVEGFLETLGSRRR